MLGIVLDMAALAGITSLLARQNMFDEWREFVLFACGLAILGFVLFLSAIPPVVALALYFGAVLVGLRFLVGASWVGAALGATLFLAYKLLLAAVL